MHHHRELKGLFEASQSDSVVSGVCRNVLEMFVRVEKDRAFHPEGIVFVFSSQPLARGWDITAFEHFRQCSFFPFKAETCVTMLQKNANRGSE